MIHQLLFTAAEAVGSEEIKTLLGDHPREAVVVTSVPAILYAIKKDQPLVALAGLGLMFYSLYQIDKAEQERQQAAQVPDWQVIHPADVAGGWRPRNRFYEVPTTILR
jgi:hypothetical protein